MSEKLDGIKTPSERNAMVLRYAAVVGARRLYWAFRLFPRSPRYVRFTPNADELAHCDKRRDGSFADVMVQCRNRSFVSGLALAELLTQTSGEEPSIAVWRERPGSDCPVMAQSGPLAMSAHTSAFRGKADVANL